MNRKDKPCEESPDYNYADCIHKQVMVDVGCQPYWFYKPDISVPKCSNSSQYISFLSSYRVMMILDVDNLYRKYKCLKPCTYMEYKVVKKVVFMSFFNAFLYP